MKILCATDFSNVSINAIQWTFDLLKSIGGGELEIVHCVESIRRSDMFVSIDDILKEQAIKDMEALENKYIDSNDNVRLRTTVHKANTKSFIPKYAKQKGYKLIVTGTTGLTSIKDMLVGSVTDYIANHSEVPILTIPEKAKYQSIESVVVGLGTEEFKNTEHLEFLYDFLSFHDPRIFLTQVLEKDAHSISVDLRIEKYLSELTYEYTPLNKKEDDDTIISIMNEYCDTVDANLLCMVHHKRSWFKKLLRKSITKEELYFLETPLLIIPA